MGARILVAEDDPKQAALIRVYLEREGHVVHLVDNGATAVDEARGIAPDIVLLDVMMPGLSGLDVCRMLRVESEVPILVLTARASEADLLVGLDAGADDYLVKPYSPRELAARVRALLRRAGPSRTRGDAADRQVVSVGVLSIDPLRYEVRLGMTPVPLTAKEFGIVSVLAREPERVFTRAAIIDEAFGFDRDVLERTVDAHVMNLRRKLAAAGGDGGTPETVYGRGYRLGMPRTPDTAPGL